MKGEATGGINSLDSGNISLYFVLKNLVYNPAVKHKGLKNLDRFVDDISRQGMWRGAEEQFHLWVSPCGIR